MHIGQRIIRVRAGKGILFVYSKYQLTTVRPLIILKYSLIITNKSMGTKYIANPNNVYAMITPVKLIYC